MQQTPLLEFSFRSISFSFSFISVAHMLKASASMAFWIVTHSRRSDALSVKPSQLGMLVAFGMPLHPSWLQPPVQHPIATRERSSTPAPVLPLLWFSCRECQHMLKALNGSCLSRNPSPPRGVSLGCPSIQAVSSYFDVASRQDNPSWGMCTMRIWVRVLYLGIVITRQHWSFNALIVH